MLVLIGIAVALILSSITSHVYAEPKDMAVARTLFQQRCNTAGETIKRTVEDVDGLLLLKIRSRDINYSQQFVLDDPYGRDLTGDGYIESFLRAHHDLPGHIERAEGRIAPLQRQVGYMYVDASDPKDGKRYRYTGSIEQPGLKDPRYLKAYFRVVLVSSPTSEPAPSYGVTYEDISTADDRRYWIAASSLKVIDLLPNEVIAERIGYMMDPGQGADGGGRSPWLMAAAHACLPSRAGAPFLVRQVKRPASLRKYCGHGQKTSNKPASRPYAIAGTLAGVDVQSA